MSKRFFTNDGENTLLKKFAGVFAHNPDIQRFDALVGYLRASGYFALRPHLQKVPQIRIIVGIDVDAELNRSHRKGLLMLGDADKTIAFVRSKLSEDVQGAPYRRDIEEGSTSLSATSPPSASKFALTPQKDCTPKSTSFCQPDFVSTSRAR